MKVRQQNFVKRTGAMTNSLISRVLSKPSHQFARKQKYIYEGSRTMLNKSDGFQVRWMALTVIQFAFSVVEFSAETVDRAVTVRHFAVQPIVNFCVIPSRKHHGICTCFIQT